MLAVAHRCACGALTLLVACRAAEVRPAERARAASTPYGTYELRLCRVRCGAEWPANTIRSGWVVLDSAPIALEVFPDSVQRWLKNSYMLISVGLESAGNGCYFLRADRPDVETYAGLHTGGLTRWEPTASGDSIRFRLYGSPDAGHEVTVVLTEDGFEGAGHSWGGGVADVDYPDDVVSGRRVGAPDPMRCGEAGLAGLAAFRKWLDGQRRRPPG